MKLVQLTLEKAKQLQYGDIIYEKNKYNCDGNNKRWKINGKVKTWKRDKTRIKIPVKYGLYEYGYITENNIDKVLIKEK